MNDKQKLELLKRSTKVKVANSERYAIFKIQVLAFLLLTLLFMYNAKAEVEDDGVYNMIANRPVDCSFNNYYPKEKDKCELAVIYEPKAKTVTLFVFKNRKDKSADFNRFLKDNSIGRMVTSFDLAELFETEAPIMSFSALFLKDQKIKLQARFTEEGGQEEKTVSY